MPNNVKKLSNDQINELIDWAIKKMQIFKDVITPFVQKLD